MGSPLPLELPGTRCPPPLLVWFPRHPVLSVCFSTFLPFYLRPSNIKGKSGATRHITAAASLHPGRARMAV